MKKIKMNVFVVTMLTPFLSVWIAWIMTAFSFDVKAVFQHGAFWGISMIYWFIWLCLIGMVIDGIKEPAK
jgi:hypothetical protein